MYLIICFPKILQVKQPQKGASYPNIRFGHELIRFDSSPVRQEVLRVGYKSSKVKLEQQTDIDMSSVGFNLQCRTGRVLVRELDTQPAC